MPSSLKSRTNMASISKVTRNSNEAPSHLTINEWFNYASSTISAVGLRDFPNMDDVSNPTPTTLTATRNDKPRQRSTATAPAPPQPSSLSTTPSNPVDIQTLTSFDEPPSDDKRRFHCPDTKWKLQPTIKLLTAYGNEVEPFGADYILQKLGFRHARLTIPKWLQRGIMDPCEQSMTVVQLFLIFLLPEHMLIQVVRNIDENSSVRIPVNNGIVRLSTLKNYFGQNVSGLKCYDSESGTWILCDIDSNGSILSEYRPWNSTEKYVLIARDDDDLRLPQAKRLKGQSSEASDISTRVEQTEQHLIHRKIGNNVF
ncbi:unnamed protein product [Rotaria sp. Silwood1]|nr:unnamed protein product [Rotaria sp. Silwood1]